MAKNAATHPALAPSPANRPAASGPALAPVVEINVRHNGRTPQPDKLTGSGAPEGWIKKIDRPREAKVWVGCRSKRPHTPSARAQQAPLGARPTPGTPPAMRSFAWRAQPASSCASAWRTPDARSWQCGRLRVPERPPRRMPTMLSESANGVGATPPALEAPVNLLHAVCNIRHCLVSHRRSLSRTGIRTHLTN
jgi:hypothetical protein